MANNMTISNQEIFLAHFSSQQFVQLSKEKALDLIWQVTYEKSIKALRELGINTKIISKNFQPLLIKQLITTYKLYHPDFFVIHIPDDDFCEQCLNELSRKTNEITTKVVSKHCYKALKKLDTIEAFDKTIELLNDTDEDKIFAGLKALGFNKAEATYLIPFHTAIHNLFKSLVTNYVDKPIGTFVIDDEF